jgi:hypothetical protein
MLALLLALTVPAARSASAADSLPSAMLGTWCTQPDDAQGTPMKRCAPGAPDAISMTRHAMNSDREHCRIVSVTTKSATRWLVEHVCDSRLDRLYGWTFFRDGESLYLAQVGTFTPLEGEPPRAGQSGCFTRIYNKAHLAKRPDQLVTSTRLHIVSDGSFALRVTKRGSDDVLSTDGTCAPKQRGLLCHVEAKDGGSFRIVPKGSGSFGVVPSGRDAALLYLNDRIAMVTNSEDSDESERWLSAGKDDDVFRLDRVDARACREMKPRAGEH